MNQCCNTPEAAHESPSSPQSHSSFRVSFISFISSIQTLITATARTVTIYNFPSALLLENGSRRAIRYSESLELFPVPIPGLYIFSHPAHDALSFKRRSSANPAPASAPPCPPALRRQSTPARTFPGLRQHRPGQTAWRRRGACSPICLSCEDSLCIFL